MPTPTWGASLAALAPAISVKPPLLLISPPEWISQDRNGEYRPGAVNVKKLKPGRRRREIDLYAGRGYIRNLSRSPGSRRSELVKEERCLRRLRSSARAGWRPI